MDLYNHLVCLLKTKLIFCEFICVTYMCCGYAEFFPLSWYFHRNTVTGLPVVIGLSRFFVSTTKLAVAISIKFKLATMVGCF